MNKAATAWIVVAVVVIAGTFVYFGSNPTVTDYSQPGTTAPTTTPTPNAPQVGAPVVVTDRSVSSTDTTAIVKGNVSPNGALTSYWFEYGTSNNLGQKTQNQMIGTGYTNTPSPAYITNLTRDTTYYYRLVAENQNGKSFGLTYSFQTTHGNLPPVGSAPTVRTLAATSVSRTAVNINGNVNPNKAETIYWFEYGKDQNLGNTTSFVSAGNGSSVVTPSLSVSNLEPATTYYFRLNAQNQFGTINGAILNFKTSGPANPSQPTVGTTNATSVAATTATLQGTVDPHGAETTYWFEYSFDSSLPVTLVKETSKSTINANGNSTSVNKNVAGLISNTTYYFRVVAQNSQGTIRGNVISFKTR